MTSRLAPLALSFCALATLLAGPASAQDDPAPQPTRAADAPAPANVDPERASRVLERMKEVYLVASSRPAAPAVSITDTGEEASKARGEYIRAKERWQRALEALPKMADEYARLAPEADADPKVRYFAGYARVKRGDIVSADEADELCTAACDDLRAYLELAPESSAYRAYAQEALAYALIRLAHGDAQLLAAAVEPADAAVRAHLADGRSDDAGRLAFLALQSLIAVADEATAARLAAGWQGGDFGASSRTVASLIRRSRVRPGEPMPTLPAMDSHAGGAMPWVAGDGVAGDGVAGDGVAGEGVAGEGVAGEGVAGDPKPSALSGKPYVLHFFATTVSSTTREVETVLVPLRKRFAEKGLQLVGVSTDRAMTDAEVERTRANWEEWGKKDVLRDGRLDSVSEWASERGVDWPWCWDGKWLNNAVVVDLGVPVNAPFAILVDKDGVIRWRGEPYQGLTEAVEKLLDT